MFVAPFGIAPGGSWLSNNNMGREGTMYRRGTIMTATAAIMLASAIAGARAGDDTKYPNWKGQWERIGSGEFDPSKRGGLAQQPPLTPEYQAVFEANLKESQAGGQNYNTQAHCLPGGMPRMMIAYEPMEVIVTPEITYIEISFNDEFRRIYTDGRDWPKNDEASFSGYSIGKWIDEDGDGRYDTLEVVTRNLKGPRLFGPSGIPVHEDNQTVIKERIYSDKTDREVLHDEITSYDHALTRPWTVTRSYRRNHDAVWVEGVCNEDNRYVFIAGETYLLGPGDMLMPTMKDQPPPDLRYFKQSPK
jgi:hypothetical protein